MYTYTYIFIHVHTYIIYIGYMHTRTYIYTHLVLLWLLERGLDTELQIQQGEQLGSIWGSSPHQLCAKQWCPSLPEKEVWKAHHFLCDQRVSAIAVG